MITMSIAPSATAKRMERPLDNRKTVKSPLPKLAQDHVAPVKNLQHVPCKFFRHGSCTAGENCPFSHSLETERPVCKYHLKGNCKFGTKCALSHSLPVNDSTISSGLPSETTPLPNHLPFGNSLKHMQNSSISSSFPQKIQRTAFDQMDMKGSINMKGNLLNPGFSASPPSFSSFSHSPGHSSASSYLNNFTSTQSLLGTANHGKQLDDYSADINLGLASSMNGVSIASSLATSPSSFGAASSASSNNFNGSKGLLHQQMSNENSRDYFFRQPSLLAAYANRTNEKATSFPKLPAEMMKANVPLQSPQPNGKVNSNLPKRRPSINHSLTGIQLSSGATRRYAVRSNSYADAFPSVVSTSLPNRVDLNHQMDMSDDEQKYLSTPMSSFDESFLGSSPIGKTNSSMKQLSTPLSMTSPTFTSRLPTNTLQNSRFGAYFSKHKYVDTNTGSSSSSRTTTPQQPGVAGTPMKMPSSFGVREESVFSSPINELTRPQHVARLKSEPIFRADSMSPVTTGGANETKNDYTLSPGSNGFSRVSVANNSPAWSSTLEEETTFQMDD
ncbi:zf-CCCH type zinc finger protein [Schizosaccharomyces octosporus yFS286]|uniref:Zf-CCCH type zinc finger protein n=1 Tax=Schizosaccharomyces octosporus (strain yFS286) TaxID=483514 RepID=S9Q039_SCHOY|nr:zf-CCCH type zinc finger protein [Schizosaccharomyces octosporus yFS286]EPX73567.1 zf-CCCH type zinc finger protein [Schizosaccharomyces octosporus yFS286]